MPEHQDIKLLKSQIFNELEFKAWNQTLRRKTIVEK